MTDPFFPDDNQRRPAPPTTGEVPTGPLYDPDATRDRDATIAQPIAPGGYAPGGFAPGAVPPGTYVPPPDGGGGSGGGGGMLVAILAVVVLTLGGVLAFAVTQSRGSGDEPVVTTGTEAGSQRTTTDTSATDTTTPGSGSVVVEPTVVEPTLVEGSAPGTVGAQAVTIGAVGEAMDASQQLVFIEGLLASTARPEISTVDDVLTLCAGVVALELVDATAIWYLDGVELESSGPQRLAPGSAGHCLGDGGASLATGTYEVEFVDSRDNVSSRAVFTVGAATVEQIIVNDTGVPVCEFDVTPATAATFSIFEFNPPLADGDELVIDVPDVELAGQAIPCDGDIFPEFLFFPTVEIVGIAAGVVTLDIAPTTPEELAGSFGRLESYDRPLAPGPERDAAIADIAFNSDIGRVATLDRSVMLCAGFVVPGPFEGEMVWEFNELIIARLPVAADDQGVVGSCVTPGGDVFDIGSYQAYLDTPDASSQVQSFTVGRAETQLTFINDTGVEICEIGFSPLLTRFYTPYFFFDENGEEEPLFPDETFTIPAPLAEVDIEVRDCAGEQVNEARAVAPTDQVVSVSTGAPV